jgi:hypothetical protein
MPVLANPLIMIADAVDLKFLSVVPHPLQWNFKCASCGLRKVTWDDAEVQRFGSR